MDDISALKNRIEVLEKENARLRKAVTDERERCAKIADKFGEENKSWEGKEIAAQIRDEKE